MTPKPGRDVTRKKKHKPQANVPHEHQCKNCKQISSKSNSYFLKGQYAMTRGGLSQERKVSWHSESASAAHHINMLKRGYIKIRRSNIWQNPIPAPDQSKAGLELEGPPQFDEASTTAGHTPALTGTLPHQEQERGMGSQARQAQAIRWEGEAKSSLLTCDLSAM